MSPLLHNGVNIVMVTAGHSWNIHISLQDELSPLLVAAIKGSVDVIPLLVQNGADLNSKDSVRWLLVCH